MIELPVLKLAHKPIHPYQMSTFGGGMLHGPGLTLREHFAGLAMQGMLASQGNGGEYFRPEVIVKEAVEFSDALIAELSKGEK